MSNSSENYSFNNTHELNQIFYDPSTSTILYRSAWKVCVVAHLTNKYNKEGDYLSKVHATGNQIVYDFCFIEGDENPYRRVLNSQTTKRLLPYCDWVRDYKLYTPINESMITERHLWIERILKAKKRMEV